MHSAAPFVHFRALIIRVVFRYPMGVVPFREPKPWLYSLRSAATGSFFADILEGIKPTWEAFSDGVKN